MLRWCVRRSLVALVRSPARRSVSRARAAAHPERGELRGLALENRRAKELTTRSDLQRVWTQTARSHGFGPDQAVRLIGASERLQPERAIEDRVEGEADRAARRTFQERDLRAVVLGDDAGSGARDRAADGPQPTGTDSGGRTDDHAGRSRPGAGNRALRRSTRAARRPGRQRRSRR